MKIRFAFTLGAVTFSGLAVSTFAFAQAESCDFIYAKRGAVLFDAVDCYQKILTDASAEAEIKALYERIFISLCAVIAENPKTELEKKAIERGTRVAAALDQRYPNAAETHYWKAVFLSFAAILSDRGSLIPTQTFLSLASIERGLDQARTLEGSLHKFGPYRVLGIMHTEMPSMAGGDKALAERYLREALRGAPDLSANWIALSNILRVRGKDAEAIKTLRLFLSKSDTDLNPYPGQPNRALTAEIALDRQLARTRLAQLLEE